MASKGDIIPLSESTAGEDSHMGEVIAFDHIHLISRDPKAVADWYKEMFGRKPQGQAYGRKPQETTGSRKPQGQAYTL